MGLNRRKVQDKNSDLRKKNASYHIVYLFRVSEFSPSKLDFEKKNRSKRPENGLNRRKVQDKNGDLRKKNASYHLVYLFRVSEFSPSKFGF